MLPLLKSTEIILILSHTNQIIGVSWSAPISIGICGARLLLMCKWDLSSSVILRSFDKWFIFDVLGKKTLGPFFKGEAAQGEYLQHVGT
jgi:hypothetical protein